MGPTSKSYIIQHLHQAEGAISIILEQVGQPAPDHLQPTIKRISVPANRRSLAPGQGPTASPSGERGANTLYILRDDVYGQVMIQDWAEYGQSQRLTVSENMEAALKRLGVLPEAEEWKRLYPDGRALKDRGGAEETLSVKHELSKSPDADGPLNMDEGEDAIVVKQPNKKKSNQDRLKSMKKTAKGRSANRISTPTPTTTKASTPKKSRVNNGQNGDETTIVTQCESSPIFKSASENRAAEAPVHSSGKAVKTVQAPKASKSAKASTSKGNVAPKAATQIKASSRKEIEYTDSSDDEEMHLDDPPLHADRIVAAKGTADDPNALKKKSSSVVAASSPSPDGKRSRQGVGSGASFSSEPWLEVRSRSDWTRLAERFKKVYNDFLKGRSRLRAEEDMIRADLEQAQSEAIKSDSSLHIDDDEREEGEASPVDGSARGILAMDFDPPSFANVTWRVNSEGGRFDKNATKPMSYEELETHVLKLKEIEAQLTRMKSALETSKKTLEENVSA